MNIEEKISKFMLDPNSKDKDIFHALFLAIQYTLANGFGFASFCGEYHDKDWVLGISIKVPFDTKIPIVGDKEFDEVLAIVNTSIKSYYDRPIDEIINFASCIIGVPKDTIDNCLVTCTLDPYQNNDLCLRDRKSEDGKKFISYFDYLPTYREYNIVVRMPDEVADNIKQFNSCKFYEYAAFIIYLLLVAITGGEREDELKERIEAIVVRAANYNKGDDTSAENNESSTKNISEENQRE